MRVDHAAIKGNERSDVLLKAFGVIEVRESGMTFDGILKEVLAGLIRFLFA